MLIISTWFVGTTSGVHLGNPQGGTKVGRQYGGRVYSKQHSILKVKIPKGGTKGGQMPPPPPPK